MIIVRPLIEVLGKIMKLPKNSYLDPTTLGSGTPSSSNWLRGDGLWSPLPSTLNQGLFAQTANSTPITNTTVETSLINGGIGSLSVPPNFFKVGDSFRVVIAGVLNVDNNQTIRIKVKDGTSILADSGAKTISNITADIFSFNVDFTIRALGVSGLATIVTLGVFHYTKTSNGVAEGFAFNNINNTTFDTTIANTLDITVQWGAANVANSIYSDICILNKTY
jgi:hypothetical protein